MVKTITVAICGLLACGAFAGCNSATASSIVCTDAHGVKHTFAPFTGTGNHGGTHSAATSSQVFLDKSRPVAGEDASYVVTSAIDGGVDPISAARDFGKLTLQDPVHASASQLAHATDPRTYGWTC